MHTNPQIHKFASNLLWSTLAVMVPISLYVTLLNKVMLIEWTLLSIKSTPITMTIIADTTGMMFSCVVLIISANVLKFSETYMKEDKFINRFTILVLMFIASMNLLIFMPNLIMLLLGWDSLGLVSFILVIYYQNMKSLSAGMVTALTNRIGDVMILISIAWSLNQGHWSILHMWNNSESPLICGAILIAAMTKSAQIPFSSWLPAAMAAPTPVSALVHSSTLVTAGVFLLIRFYPFLSLSKLFSITLLIIATTTTTMAGLSAMMECDVKKIIALSTLSQLGMMMATMGLGMVNLAYLQMMVHALFKALLFICAGTLIHSHTHGQDLRWMGNMTSQMPTTTSCFLLANMAMCGIPFFSGFYTKDMIIESSIFYPQNLTMVAIIMLNLSITTFYSVRLSINSIWAPMNSTPFIQLKENSNLTKPMLILTLMSTCSGSMFLWTVPNHNTLMVISPMFKLMPLIMILLGLMMAWTSSTMKMTQKPLTKSMPLLHNASYFMWFLMPLSSQFMMKTPMLIAHHYLKSVDQSWLELAGGQGIMNYSFNTSNKIMNSQSSPPMNMMLMSMMFTTMIIMIL